jgi:hypothetical protein
VARSRTSAFAKCCRRLSRLQKPEADEFLRDLRLDREDAPPCHRGP